MSASTSCTGTLISPPDIHPSLLHPGNLVPKDLFSITSTWKLNTEGFTHPRTCTRGRFCFISPLCFKWSTLKQQSWSFIRHHHHVATCITRDATFPCQCFKTSDTQKTKRDGRESLCGKISLPNVSRKRQKKNKPWAHSQTQNTLLTLRICVHTSVRSHHIIFFCGEENTAVRLWFIFVLFPPPDCSLVLAHLHAHTNTEIHTSTRVRHLDSGWPGTPITLSPSLKS